MAIIDPSKKPYIVDRDENIFVGIDLPFRLSTGPEGYFASTSTTTPKGKLIKLSEYQMESYPNYKTRKQDKRYVAYIFEMHS